jgi:deazaflavin-dependent oxidoreductase (nitroreductase family)
MATASNEPAPRRGGRGVARITNTLGHLRAFAVRSSRWHARMYRKTGGRFGRKWFGAPVLVLETVGRRSGKPRATPVIYIRDGERLVVVAANAGVGPTPAWWLNLRQAGRATVVVDGERIPVRARQADLNERERLRPRLVDNYPALEHYPTPNGAFPVVIMEPEGHREAAGEATP